jgi:hypothetical protein
MDWTMQIPPAFAGFARLLLPWDGLRYDEAMRLSDIGSLLPYHSHVVPETVVGALNRMIDDVNSGHAVFYRRSVLGEIHHSTELMRGTPRCSIRPRGYLKTGAHIIWPGPERHGHCI